MIKIIMVFEITFVNCLVSASFFLSTSRWFSHVFLSGLSLHLNHLIGSQVTNYDWPFGILSFGIFWSNLDTMDIETYPRTYSGQFEHMSIFDKSSTI